MRQGGNLRVFASCLSIFGHLALFLPNVLKSVLGSKLRCVEVRTTLSFQVKFRTSVTPEFNLLKVPHL